jgi:hypothetical protein
MTPEGAVLAGEQERRYAALGRLMLAHKYSRPDLIGGLLERLSTGTPEQRSAAAEFEERVRNGDVPDPLDPEGRVATFVDGQYAVHRF